VNSTGRGSRVVDPALAWSNGLKVEVGGAGTVAHAGVVLGNGLPGRRLSRALSRARAKAWAAIIDRHRGLPAVTVAGTDLRRARDRQVREAAR
jgi:hypothetical protein